MSLQKRSLVLSFAVACLSPLLLVVDPAAAQQPTSILPNRPDADAPTVQETQRLGKDFESAAAGIAFRAPAGMKEIPSVAGDVVVRYVDDKRHWVLIVTKLTFDRPMKLETPQTTPDGQKPQKGLIDLTTEQMKLEAPGAEILRQDKITVGGAEVGMLASRYTIGSETDLTQQALFCSSDKVFYQFNLTVPAPHTGDMSDDPGIKSAVATFTDVLDSVHLLEQTAVHDDQVQRLYRTRTLFVNTTEEKIRKALIHEQWQRIIKDGKDIGYSYIVEEVGKDLPRPGHKESQNVGGSEGALIGVRTRIVPEPGIRNDAETWMWFSFDRRHEKWSNIVVTDRGTDAAGNPLRDHVGDVGSSDVREKSVYDPKLEQGERIGPGKNNVDLKQPAYKRAELYTLHVEQIGKNRNGDPIARDLPVWYIPQGFVYLLPRLVPLKEPTSFMVASFVNDRSPAEVMNRYIEVAGREQVTLDHKTAEAVPVHDRVGLDGFITTYYISPAGAYFLGAVNKDSKIVVLPTDAATLQKIWKDVDLSRPGAVPETAAPN